MDLLQSLPNELLEAIVNNVSREDLPHLRLTCLLLAKIATKPLFKEVTLGTSTESGKKFIEILASEEIRACVSQLTFDSSEIAQTVKDYLTSAPQANSVHRSLRVVP